MKKLVLIFIIIIAFTFSINTYALEIPEADVNVRSYSFTYQTYTQDEILYYSGYNNITYSGKKQVIQHISALYGDYEDSVYGGAKIHYYNSVGGSVLSSVAIDLNTYHDLDISYNYYRVQLVYRLNSNISDDRIEIEYTYLPYNDYTTISEGVAISATTIESIYNQGFNDGEQFAYDDAYDDGYTAGYNVGLNDDVDFNVIGNNVASGMGDILGLEIGGISLGALVLIPLSFSLFMWFLKVVRK
jgi:hypothetical protein